MRSMTTRLSRFGYRRVGAMLMRDGIVLNLKRLSRLCFDEGLFVKGQATTSIC
jgi:putative transposase